jgi:amino acid permease
MKKQHPNNTAITIINVMMGTGPLIIPPVFLLAGIGLSSIFTIFIGTLSYLSAMFVIEALSIANALTFIKRSESSVTEITHNLAINNLDQHETADPT